MRTLAAICSVLALGLWLVAVVVGWRRHHDIRKTLGDSLLALLPLFLSAASISVIFSFRGSDAFFIAAAVSAWIAVGFRLARKAPR